MSEDTVDPGVVRQLVRDGFATLRVSQDVRGHIARVFNAAEHFFNADSGRKHASAAPERLEGYRPVGKEYSLSPDRPDLCESFSHWLRNADDKASWKLECDLYEALRLLSRPYTELASGVLEAVRHAFAPDHPTLDFRETSYLQVNYYRPAAESRDFLQDHHEDGHLFTLVKGTAKGLEVLVRGEYVPVSLAEDEVLVMPGSILTLMTGGGIPPLYHRVRRHPDVSVRTSLMFFVNPSMNARIKPWVSSPMNSGVDIRVVALERSEAFGLPRFDQVITPAAAQ